MLKLLPLHIRTREASQSCETQTGVLHYDWSIDLIHNIVLIIPQTQVCTAIFLCYYGTTVPLERPLCTSVWKSRQALLGIQALN